MATPSPATAAEMYEAMRAQRRVLESQQSELRQDRDELSSRLRDPQVTGADRAGLESRLQNIDAQLIQLDAQLATARQQEALAAAQPGAIVQEPSDPTGDIVEAVAVIGSFFMFVCVLPLSIAYARRIWRKHAYTVQLTPEMTQRLDGIERAVEATALEVERIGEGQRFVTQLMASRTEGAKVPLPASQSKTPS